MTAPSDTARPVPTDTAIVLCIAGHDPSGGAGIQADIETIHSLGGHALSLISCHTLQDSNGLQEVWPADTEWVRRQAALLMADFPIAAIKLGALGSAEAVGVAADIIRRARLAQPDLPVILDPVLLASAGSTRPLTDAQGLAVLRSEILPVTSIATPNLAEVTRLTSLPDNPAAAARQLLNQGTGAVLITGTDSPASQDQPITHWLYTPTNPPQAFHCPRLAGQYHGSGCTLAAALALFLAQGANLNDAVAKALDYCWHSLAAGRQLGRGQRFPDRRISHPAADKPYD